MEISITWNICRVCLVEEEKKPQGEAGVTEPMRHIFKEDEMLAKQIYECSGIKIRLNDNLPEKICKKCYTLLKYAVNFRETCRASDAYLHNILQRTKSASALFKKQQLPSLDPLKEIISYDCSSLDNNDGDTNVSSDKLKCTEADLGKSSKRDSERSDMIEFENVDFINENDLKNSVTDNILDYTGSCTSEDNSIHGREKQGSENDDCEILVQLNTVHNQDLVVNELTEEERQDSNSEFKQNYDDHGSANIESEDEDIVESYEQLEEFILVEESTQRGITSDMESESGDSQAKVSSTVAIREDGTEKIGLGAEDTTLSTEASDMQAEYILEEIMFDDSSHDSISLENSSAPFIHSKKANNVVKKYETHTNFPNPKIDIATSKAGKDFHVWACDICGNHFGNRQILKGHIKVHRQEKNHECEICLKRFITACNLQAHMRIHTGEKPFECKYCGRRFSDRSSSLRHERTHTNERPYVCKECGKAFSLGTTLKKHLKVHSGVRLFGCDICAKSFKLPHQLKAHKNSTLHKAVEQLTQVDQ